MLITVITLEKSNIYPLSITTSAEGARMEVLMGIGIARVHSRVSHHGLIHLKRRNYAVYYCRIGLRLINHE
jgi:hypothetical protein